MEDYQNEDGTCDPCFYYEIPGGLLDKDVIEIKGYFCGEKIVVEVLAEKYIRGAENTAMPLQFTLTNRGEWKAMTYTQTVPCQAQSGTTTPVENFEIRIIAFDSAFEIHLNGNRLCTQKHLIPLPQVTHLSIDGEAEFTGVEFKDLCSENETSDRSNTSLSSQNQYPGAFATQPGFMRLSENRRSSNRKPKSPVLVRTRGSSRGKPTSGSIRNEVPLQLQDESDLPPIVRSNPAPEPVQASVIPPADMVTSSSKLPTQDSNISVSGKHSVDQSGRARDSKLTSLREKMHFKRSSRHSVPNSAHDGASHATTGSLEDVWMEESGRELSADGAGVLYAGEARSTPNLSTQTEKRRKKIGITRGSKKTRSVSSPPVETGPNAEGKDKKKHHFGGLHIGKGSSKDSKKEKEVKPQKESKKRSPFGTRHHESHSASPGGAIAVDVGGGTNAALVTQKNVTGEFSAPEVPEDKAKPSLLALSHKNKSATSTPRSPLHASLSGYRNRGSYNLESAQKSSNAQYGTYEKMHYTGRLSSPISPDGSMSPSPDPDSRSKHLSTSELEYARDVETVVSVDGEQGKQQKGKAAKIKGDSPFIASKLMSGSAGSRNSIDSLTHDVASLEIPLHMVSSREAAPAGTKEEHRKKDKEGKIKGSSAEISDNLLGGKRAMLNEYLTYTGTYTTVPLKLTQEDLLSTGRKGFGPVLGSRGSYSFEKTPDTTMGSYQLREDTDWASEDSILRTPATSIQHSRPPEKIVDVGATGLATPAVDASKKGKKSLLKGESAEIASNLWDEEGDRIHGRISLNGVPLCGENGVNVPWKLEMANRDAQPIPYWRLQKARSPSMDFHSPDTAVRAGSAGDFAIMATREGVVHAAAPTSGDASLRAAQSATLPTTGGGSLKASRAHSTATLSGTDIVTTRSGKKGHKGGVEGEDKEHKRHRVSDFFSNIFRRKKKRGVSRSDHEDGVVSEGVGTDPEMTEHLSSSEFSLEDEYDENNFNVTAKPSETGLYASQLLGSLPALRSGSSIVTMCGDRTPIYPLRLTAADIPTDIHRAGEELTFSAPPLSVQRRESLESWSSVSVGGTRRHHHRKSTRDRADLKQRSGSVSSWSSTSPGGSRRHYRRSSRHRPESVSSWSSISPGGTRRHRRRPASYGDAMITTNQASEIQREHQIPAYAAVPLDDRDLYFNIHKQESTTAYSAPPKPESNTSSNSSIPGLYGRVVLVGQSPDFRTRIQSYQKVDMSKKTKHSRDSRGVGENGYDSYSSDSSVSSIASDKLPPSVVKVKGDEYAKFENAGETIFFDQPRRAEDTYANVSRY